MKLGFVSCFKRLSDRKWRIRVCKCVVMWLQVIWQRAPPDGLRPSSWGYWWQTWPRDHGGSRFRGFFESSDSERRTREPRRRRGAPQRRPLHSNELGGRRSSTLRTRKGAVFTEFKRIQCSVPVVILHVWLFFCECQSRRGTRLVKPVAPTSGNLAYYQGRA